MTLQLLYRSHLTKSSWNAGFCISSIPLCITKLLGQENRVADIVNVDNIFITEKILPAHVLFSYVVICSYYIHNICLMYVQKGFDTEFFAKGLLLVFLYTCYSVRYVCTFLITYLCYLMKLYYLFILCFISVTISCSNYLC
jgi:hypothetical protein